MFSNLQCDCLEWGNYIVDMGRYLQDQQDREMNKESDAAANNKA